MNNLELPLNEKVLETTLKYFKLCPEFKAGGGECIKTGEHKKEHNV